MTGHPSRAGYVATYPVADPGNDLVPMNTYEAYQPMMTVMEAARITQQKSTGLVITCEFPHATPADCSAHSYNRGKYEWIVPQIVHNQIDVVIGGGVSLLTDELKTFLSNTGYGVFTNDINNFRNYKGNKMWSLFGDMDMAYNIDRDTSAQPSLAEMTKVAIDKLSTNENGFVLMVEGSKVDWAAHNNDAIALITDMVAFDKACGVALDFAKENGETLIVIVPDHGNSGFSIGTRRCTNYSSMSKEELFGPVARFKVSRDALIQRLHQTDSDKLKEVVLELSGISLTDEEYQKILQCADYKKSNLSNEKRTKDSKLSKIVAEIVDDHTCFGFTTGGHTGEEVFLAVYDPTPNRMTGHHTNIQINHYLRQSLGLESLESLTASYFAKHTDVFNGYSFTIKKGDSPLLEVKNKKNTLQIQPNTNIVKRNGKEIALSSVIVYVDKNDTFYLPQSLAGLLE
jgi:alkaline phosphatase